MRFIVRWAVVSFVMVALSAVVGTTTSRAAEVELAAFAGEPFGVGKMTVLLRASEDVFPDTPIGLTDKESRVLYPAFHTGHHPGTSAGRTATGSKRLTVYFLFRRPEPLDLTLQTDLAYHATAAPLREEAAHSALVAEWWDHYTAAALRVVNSDTYRPLVENYLLATLGRRLNLSARKLPSRTRFFWKDRDDFFTTLTGFESVRLAAQTDVLLKDTVGSEAADQPLPRPAKSPPIDLPQDVGDVAIEPIAMHVPEECFYVRCGSFASFRWLRSRIEDWGTYLRDVTSMRGLDYRIMPRLERQLALRETLLATLLGDAVISDVAVLGTDTFLREGASIGILFEARDRLALDLHIRQQRHEALSREKNAREQSVQIEGHTVSLLSTPDNRVRSFYAVDGDYHLVTTSKTLVRRFFEAGREPSSLGRSKEFQWARSKEPLSEGHTIFVYLSDPFFRLLVSPQYRIEMTRRIRAAAEIDVVRLARLAARAEGRPATAIAQLVTQRLLPAGFGHQPDGSHVVVAGSSLTDSLRGACGAFLPVPDVEITGATPSEVQAYRNFAQQYESLWRRMDPIIIAIKRRPLPGGGKERVVFDLHVTPFAQSRYGWLSGFLSPEDANYWKNAPGDVALIQAQFRGDKLALGVHDFQPEFKVQRGGIIHERPRGDNVPYYMVVPQSPTSFFGNVEILGDADADGNYPAKYAFQPWGDPLWARDLNGYYLLSSNKKLLGQIAPHVKLVDVARPARGRLWVADLSKAKAASVIDAESYLRARKISGGNVRFLSTLMQQLRVPANEAKSTAERLLQARLVCPLGGTFELTPAESRAPRWRSTAWKHASLYQVTRTPDGFRSPVFDWFAGVSIALNFGRNSLSSHIELDAFAKPVQHP
ncbi:MAG: hypothetical protein ACC628_16930 [Pirellulaceae bacterium]